MQYAAEYLKQNNLPTWTPVTRIVESGETPVFKSQFVTFDEIKRVETKVQAVSSPKARQIDVSAIFQKQQREAEEKMVDDGTGKITIWRIQNLAKSDLPKELYGQFYQGDSYIVLYNYKDKSGRKENFIIYFWQGRDSSTDEKGASALLTIDLDNHLKQTGAQPVQVRVVQNKEPNHFLTLFKGKMIVHHGGVPSAFLNRHEASAPSTNLDAKGVALYHIKGTDQLNTRAIQVHPVAASLNAADCFTCLTPQTAYVWCGKGSNAAEKVVAMNIVKILQGSRSVQQIDEDAEPAEFWAALGGKGEYSRTKELEEGVREARLFNCSTVVGSFKVTEIFNFTQDDLINDDVMILDTYTEVFVWVGHDSTKEEKDLAMSTALDYVKKAPDGRSADTPVYRVFAGHEPPNFSCHFFGWDDTKAADFEDPYAKSLQKLGVPVVRKAADSKEETKVERVSADLIGFIDPTKQHFTQAQLIAGVQNINPAAKEQYLADAEFVALFKMSKDDFNKLSKWKKDEAKKKTKLF